MSYDYQTSLPAFKEPGKDICRSKVLDAIKKLGWCCDRQIAEFLDWPINRVTPRRGELFTAGKIENFGLRKYEGRAVNWWRVKIEVIQSKLFI